KIDYRKTALLDLGPYPDATEYFAQGTALLKDRWPSIQIGYDKLPSRYPVGYPVLMLPWLKILPKADSILAPFRTNQTLGLLLLVTVFSFYVCLFGPRGGTPLENLSVGNFPRPLAKHPGSVSLLRAAFVGDGSIPSQGKPSALVSPLCFPSGRFRAGGQSDAGAKHDPVSFAIQNRI